METKLEHILTNSYKAEMISFLRSHPEYFEEAIRLAVSDKQPYSWRAAWLLWSCMNDNDPRVQKYIKNIIDTLPATNDGQQRELLMILQRMELTERYEGKLFDICLTIWEKTGKKPSVRYNAFKVILKIVKKHPDLSGEIMFLTESQYVDSLSNGVKRAIYRMLGELNKNIGRS